jgi:hypothetical protein
MDKIIKSIKEKYKEEIEIKYSLISEYFENVLKEKLEYEKINDKNFEFFPYIDSYPFDVWTGYYSMRLNLKEMIVKSENYLKTIENLLFLVLINYPKESQIYQKIKSDHEIIKLNTWLFSVNKKIKKSIMMQLPVLIVITVMKITSTNQK